MLIDGAERGIVAGIGVYHRCGARSCGEIRGRRGEFEWVDLRPAGIDWIATLAYRKDKLPKVPPPRDWEDLFDPRLKEFDQDAECRDC